jgi:hypothetical protein
MKTIVSLLLAFQLYTTQAQKVQDIDETKFPKIETIDSLIRTNYSLDTLNIGFEIIPQNSTYTPLGVYIPWSDSLKLNYYNILRVATKNNLNIDSLTTTTINHELGHYKVDKIQERLGLKSLLDNQYSRDLMEIYLTFLKVSERDQGITKALFQNFVEIKHEELTTLIIDRMINEGIATYYEKPNNKPIESSWPISITNIQTYNDYDRYVFCTGWNLMYPIISKHKDKGIEYVLQNMPKNEEISNLQGYQKRILDELKK